MYNSSFIRMSVASGITRSFNIHKIAVQDVREIYRYEFIQIKYFINKSVNI